jgi:formylmethanofuran dehydrogenase subunit D
MSTKLQATLITGRTIDQGVGKEMGKGTKEYVETAALCFLNKEDIQKLRIRQGSNIQVTSKFGSVIVKSKPYPRGSNPGIVFIPCGLWANAVCGDDTYGMGMPLFKGFPVTVEPAPNKPILTVDELLKEEYGKETL